MVSRQALKELLGRKPASAIIGDACAWYGEYKSSLTDPGAESLGW